MPYTTTRRHTVASSTAQHLARTSDALEAFGIKLPKSITEANDKARASLQRLTEYRAEANPQAFAREVEGKLAEGTATIAELMAAASAKATAVTDPSAAFGRMFSNAETLVSSTLHKAYAAHGDAWVTETLRSTVDKHVATILAAAPELIAVDPRLDPYQLETLTYIPAVVEAWSSLDGIYKAFHDLRSLSIVPSTFERNDCYQFDGRPGARDAMQPNSITWFVWAGRNGHKPGIYTEAETEHNWK